MTPIFTFGRCVNEISRSSCPIMLTASSPRPTSDVVISWRLAGIFELGHLGGCPCKRLRELRAAHASGRSQLTESSAKCDPCLVDVRGTRGVLGWQSHPVGRRDA